MRLSFVVALLFLALIIVLCESKSTKKADSHKTKDHAVKKSSKPAKEKHSKNSSAKHEASKKSKVAEKKGKIAKPKKEKASNELKDKAPKLSKDKTTKSKTPNKSNTKSNKTSDKSVNPKAELKTPKENLKVIPKDCDSIVQEYSDGKLVMYEYKIKMAKCLKRKSDAKSTITSKYEDEDEDEGNENFFRNALKFTQDDDEKNDDNDDNDSREDDQEEKKSDVPSEAKSDLVNTQNMDTSVPQQQQAAYYPSQDQSYLDQSSNQAPAQANAAFSQDSTYNQAAPAQQNYNYYTRSNIPAAPQAQDTNQWNTPVAQPQVDATKKDILPAAPAPDPFAQFMNIQSSPDTALQAIQQRSDIPSDQSQANMVTAPANQQAYFRDQYRMWSPEDDGIFPENP